MNKATHDKKDYKRPGFFKKKMLEQFNESRLTFKFSTKKDAANKIDFRLKLKKDSSTELKLYLFCKDGCRARIIEAYDQKKYEKKSKFQIFSKYPDEITYYDISYLKVKYF